MSVTITRKNLKTETQNPLTILDFWAPWCGPCKMMDPVMHKLERKFSGRIHFGRMNVDHHWDLAKRYQIFSIPSLVVFEHGKAHEKVTGYYSFEPLAKFFRSKIKEVQ